MGCVCECLGSFAYSERFSGEGVQHLSWHLQTAKMRGATFTSKVRGLVPANPERWELQAANKNHTATWKPANRYNQSGNKWKSQSGVNQLHWHRVEVWNTVSAPLPPEPPASAQAEFSDMVSTQNCWFPTITTLIPGFPFPLPFPWAPSLLPLSDMYSLEGSWFFQMCLLPTLPPA